MPRNVVQKPDSNLLIANLYEPLVVPEDLFRRLDRKQISDLVHDRLHVHGLSSINASAGRSKKGLSFYIESW